MGGQNTSNGLEPSLSAPSVTRASRPASRSEDRIVKRLCADPQTREKAQSLYQHLKENAGSELHSKSGVQVVCAYLATEILGNDDVKKETAKVTSALPMGEFLGLLQEVRSVLAKTMPTVCYKTLIRMGKLSDGNKLEALMQAVENVLVTRATGNPTPSPSRDTFILTAFHWVYWHLQLYPSTDNPEIYVANFGLDHEITGALTESLSPRDVPLFQKVFKKRGSTWGVGTKSEVSAISGCKPAPAPQPISQDQNTYGQKRKYSSVVGTSESPPTQSSTPLLIQPQTSTSPGMGLRVPQLTFPTQSAPYKLPRPAKRLHPVNLLEQCAENTSGLRPVQSKTSSQVIPSNSQVAEVTQKGQTTSLAPKPLFKTFRLQLDPAVASSGLPGVTPGQASHPAVVMPELLDKGDPNSVDRVNIQFLATQVSKATWGVVEHVEKFGCSDITLKLRILDLKTRMMELKKAGESGAQANTTKPLHEGIRVLQKEVVKHASGVENDGEAISLRLKIMDLSTRLRYLAVFTGSSED